MTTTNDWSAALARHAQNYADFVNACYALAPALREQAGACGTWSARQVIAHLAGWYAEAARRYAEMTIHPQESTTYDVDAYNAQSVALRATLTWEETLRDLQSQHDAFIACATKLTSFTLTTTNGFAEWLESTGEDCALHAAQLREWARNN